jgi:hypothetical protein
VPAHGAGDEACEQAGGLGRPDNLVLEVDLHLEQFLKVRIELAEQGIKQPLAHQHHLDRQRDRVRLQRDGCGYAQMLGRGFDAYGGAFQCALQRLPCERLYQDAARIDDEVAAIGLVQGARLDQPEIGHQSAHLGDVLDPAEEICAARGPAGGHADPADARKGAAAAAPRPTSIPPGVRPFWLRWSVVPPPAGH